MKFAQKMHQSITFPTTSSTCNCLQSFQPKEHRKSKQLDERSSIMSAHKGVKGGGWQGGQEIDLKMEADHDWTLDTRLQGYAGSLVADV